MSTRRNHPAFERTDHFLDYLTQVGPVQIVRGKEDHQYKADEVVAQHRGFLAIRPAAEPEPHEQED